MPNNTEHSDHAVENTVLPTGRYVKLHRVLPLTFLLLISAVAMLVVFLMQSSASTSIEALAKVVMTRVSQRVLEKARYYLESAASVVQINATALQPNLHASENNHAPFLTLFNQTTTKQLKLFPYFGLIYQGDQQGNHWLNKREQDGTVHVRVITRKENSPASQHALKTFANHPKITDQDRQAIAKGIAPYLETYWYEQKENGQLVRGEKDTTKVYDPRMRPWYLGAKEHDRLFWTDVYAWEDRYQGTIRHQVGITASAPMVQDGQLIGVSGIDISLQALSTFLREMEIMKNGRAFILNDKGEVVGLPNYEDVLGKMEENTPSVQLNHISKISDQAIAASYPKIRASLKITEQQPLSLQQKHLIAFDVAKQRYYGFYTPFTSDFGLNWTVGVVIPEDDFLGDIKQEMQQNLVVVLISIGCMLLIGIFVSRMITRPLHDLEGEVEQIIRFDLAPTPPLDTKFQELGLISFAFTRMKLELARMVNTISSHTKTLDWSSEDFSDIALILEDSTKTMHESIEASKLALQDMPEQVHSEKIMVAITQMEESLSELRNLSQPVTQKAQKMTDIALALREALQVFRI